MKTHRPVPICALARILLLALPVFGVLPLLCPMAVGQEELPNILRVEEDWELVVANPDSTITAPQITCAIFPAGDSDSICATFELNHQTQPDFIAGGLQLQVWDGEALQNARSFPRDSVMATDGERVTWTQTMTLQGNVLTFEITNGHSTTWGAFGGQGYLRSSIVTQLSNLNNYNPRLSVLNSGVGFSGNRVESLSLKAIRLVTDTGQLFEDSTFRPVYPRD